MVYELTKDYLFENFTGDSTDTDFSPHHVQSLAQQISLNSDGQIADYKDEIRQALKDFWGSVGHVSVFFKGRDKLAVKVIPKAQEEVSVFSLREAVTGGDELGFVKDVIHELCDKDLDFSLINNRIWESSYLAYVKTAFYKAVYQFANGNKESATEVSLDIIRDNFAYLNDSLAEELLSKMLVSRKAETFLEYYGKTVLGDGGIRFKTPEIIDRKKRQWHVSTIRPVVAKHLKELTIKNKNLQQTEDLAEKIETLKKELEELEESRDRIENEKIEAIITYSESGERLQDLRSVLSNYGRDLNATASMEKRSDIEEKIRKQKDLIEDAKQADITARINKSKFEKMSKERAEKEFKLKKKIDGLRIQLKSEEGTMTKQNNMFEGTKEAYDYIVDAVANALMRKKIVVD
ncbi:MAG: hypothetical protein OIF32_06575 [Campylobacterales bacterium]|nr:hypothetical protein [Campylobacterales bacterium]